MSSIESIYLKYENLIDKLYNKEKELLVEDFNVTDNEIVKDDIKIIFNKLKIVTMTINAILPLDIDFDNFILLLDKNKDINILEKKFYNSRTLKVDINKNNLNVKYFKNGSLQITGCKDINNITDLINSFIKVIKENKETIMIVRKDNDELLKLLQKYKINELKNFVKVYNIDTYIPDKTDNKKLKKNQLIDFLLNDTLFVKEHTIKKKYNKNNIDNFKIEDSKIRISMINSSYSIEYQLDDNIFELHINRQKLFGYLKSTNINCYYDNTQHQGVKINFMYNDKRIGICDCKENCILKKNKDRLCKKITILIFQSGKIVITGSNDFKQNELCYEYLNNIISEKYHLFLQIKI